MNEKLVAQFYTAITDCFKPEEERSLDSFPQIDDQIIEDEDGSALTLSIFMAFKMFVCQISDFDGDPLDFINVLTHFLMMENIKNAVDEAKKE